MSNPTDPSATTNGFRPLTSEEEKLDQLLAWLEEHTTLFSALAPTLILQDRATLSPAEFAEWSAKVEAARQQANNNAARLGDEISHASRMVLGAAADQSLPYQRYADGKVSFRDVTVPVTTSGWHIDSLPLSDGSKDTAPAIVGEPASGAAADTSVDVRVFTPTNPTGSLIIAAHGGSWWMGNGACRDMLFGPDAAALAEVSGAVVLDVDYRLAPEHPLPAPINDVLAVTQWARDHADELGIDPAKIVLWGTSSGGHVAALTAAITAASGREPYAGLLLTMPALDLTGIRPEVLRAVYGQLLEDSSAFVSPVKIAPELLPPTHVQLAEREELVRGGESWPAPETTVTTLLATHIVATPKVQRERIVDLAVATLRLTNTERDLPEDPDATYSAEAVDQANRQSWGPVLRPDEL
ncbi:alpha/beta hydrolase [Corynebacterium ulceribovis]|uniref:alpha/beta hydrolase n=1 Tax=Corynebacterium ulceribovis TaxID=487732 RepID=UPI0003739395|nr:alpha/beta hydrolase fold domain-containing protein [Corynebacterium ulceribovis]